MASIVHGMSCCRLFAFPSWVHSPVCVVVVVVVVVVAVAVVAVAVLAVSCMVWCGVPPLVLHAVEQAPCDAIRQSPPPRGRTRSRPWSHHPRRPPFATAFHASAATPATNPESDLESAPARRLPHTSPPPPPPPPLFRVQPPPVPSTRPAKPGSFLPPQVAGSCMLAATMHNPGGPHLQRRLVWPRVSAARTTRCASPWAVLLLLLRPRLRRRVETKLRPSHRRRQLWWCLEVTARRSGRAKSCHPRRLSDVGSVPSSACSSPRGRRSHRLQVLATSPTQVDVGQVLLPGLKTRTPRHHMPGQLLQTIRPHRYTRVEPRGVMFNSPRLRFRIPREC